jgi:hypothetical protein
MARFVTPLLLATALCLPACGPARQSAATQPGIAAFDPAKSDPKALAIADQVMTALGGEANWQKAHEIQWFQAIIVDGKMADASSHSWDRWNGRHNFSRVDPDGKLGVSMHDLFSKTGGYGYVQGKKGEHTPMSADKDKMVAEARRRFETDAYPFVIPFKLKDPGVHLKYAEERPEEGAKPGAPIKFDVIEITFDDGVGAAPKDTWWLVIDRATHMPDSVEHHVAGKPDIERQGFTLEKWVEAGGLKFATVRKTLGYTRPDAPLMPIQMPKDWEARVPPDLAAEKMPNPGEIVLVGNVKVNAEPTEDEYIPPVN